ncbi:MAG: zinc-binding dehydrogenase [Acidimicrobiia bacterium]|nr:zinc-binding dehydrogenase [Acidimicrobiia bacterium]
MLSPAALVTEPGRVEISEISFPAPREGEVILRMEAAGVCRTDYKVSKGLQPGRPARYPMLLGHEGAGVVEEVGPGVDRLKAGERVAVGCRVPCGACSMCRRNDPRRCNSSGPRPPQVTAAGVEVSLPIGLGMYAERVPVDAGAVFSISDDLPMTSAALLGCAVMTGTGAVLHTARVWPGATTAVIGCGGIGLSTLQGAKLANASAVIAIDISDQKLDWAMELGATHAVNSSREDPVEAVFALTDGDGVDFSFEAVGMGATLEQALAMLSYGGVATMIGVPPVDSTADLGPSRFFRNTSTLMTTHGGEGIPAHDFPVLDALYRDGRLKLDEMVSHTIPLSDMEQGFENLETGSSLRTVVVPDR